MKKLSIVIVLLVLLPSSVFAGWQWVNPWPTNEYLIDWSEVSPDVHVALGRNGYILRSLDGGFTWTGTYGGEVAKLLYAIFFVSPTTGYGLANQGEAKKRILKTMDGGETWADVYRVTNSENRSLNDIYFVNEQKGFIVGNEGLVLSTSNGGTSWKEQHVESDWWNPYLSRVVFFDQLSGYIFGSSAQYWKTTDGGDTWVSAGWDNSVTPRFLLNPAVWYGLFYNDWWPGIGHDPTTDLLKTEDAGATWTVTPLDCYIDHYVDPLFFRDDGIGVIVDSHGRILRTTDGGRTFQVAAESGCNGGGVAAKGNGNIFVFGCGLKRSEDGGATWAELWRWPLAASTGLWGGLFVDSNTGYFLDDWSIYKTSDSGVTWHQIFVQGGEDVGLWSLSFPSARVGYALGRDVWKTTDGGETWGKILSPGPGSWNSYSSLNRMQFPMEQEGFVSEAVGYNCETYPYWVCDNSKFHLKMTRDGGDSWSEVEIPTTRNTQYRSASFHFPTATVGYVAVRWDNPEGRGTEIWKLTVDGETPTTALVSELDMEVEVIHFRDEWVGLAAGGGRLFRTTDGASTWQEVTDLDDSYVSPRKILYDEVSASWWLLNYDGSILRSANSSGTSFRMLWSPYPFGDIVLRPQAIWGVVQNSSWILSYPLGPAEGLSPEQPTNIEPQDGAALTQEPVMLKASPFRAQNAFYTHAASEWQVASEPGFPEASILLDSGRDQVNLTTFTVPPGVLAFGQTYYFRVRYQNNNTLWSAWSRSTTFRLNRPPEQPGVNPSLWPPDGVFYATAPVIPFAIYLDPDGDPQRAAEVVISRGPNCQDPVWSALLSGAISQVSVPAGILASGSTYCVQVRYQDGNLLWSEWSAPAEIKVSGGPQQPTNLRPAAEAEIDSVQLEASPFADAFAAQRASHWQICRGEDFFCILFDGENTSGDLVRLMPPNVLVADRTYSWRVRYQNAHGVWSPWSQPTSFTFVPFP